MEKNRHESMGLTDDDVLDIYQTMLLARKVDQRTWLLNRAGKVPFVVSCQGQEAAQAGAAFALNKEKDYILPYYRDLGIVLAFGMTPKEVMLASFANKEDPSSGGRQMPNHFGKKENRIVTGSSPVTTQLPHAAGIALAAKMNHETCVAFTSLGEGSTNQGDFHEALNFAGVHQLPMITFVENNRYAISVPLDKQIASENISVRAKGYGITGITIDGNDPLTVYEAVHDARERAIRGEGPTLIEAMTERLTAHSSDDDDAYRDSDIVEQAKEKDNLNMFAHYLRNLGILTKEVEDELNQNIDQLVNEATEYAENAADPEAADALKFVYEEDRRVD